MTAISECLERNNDKVNQECDMNTGIWKKGNKTMNGKWKYNRSSDTFTIFLDSFDPVTGQQRVVTTYDEPNFNGWEIIRVS